MQKQVIQIDNYIIINCMPPDFCNQIVLWKLSSLIYAHYIKTLTGDFNFNFSMVSIIAII